MQVRGVARILVGGGGASDKIFSKVARISVHGKILQHSAIDNQQNFTQQRLWKILKSLYKIRTKI